MLNIRPYHEFGRKSDFIEIKMSIMKFAQIEIHIEIMLKRIFSLKITVDSSDIFRRFFPLFFSNISTEILFIIWEKKTVEKSGANCLTIKEKY